MRAPEACRRARITFRQLDYWARIGLVIPSIAEATGSGSLRLYSDDDLTELLIVKAFCDAGRQPSSARPALEAWRRSPGDYIVLSGTSAWCVAHTNLELVLSIALEEGGTAIVLDVPAVREEVPV